MKRRPNILFIATRQPSYPRVAITLKAMQASCRVDCIVSNCRSYPVRFASILTQILAAALDGRLRHADAVCLGFLAQPLVPIVRRLYRGPIVSDAFVSVYDTLVHDKRKVALHSWLAWCCWQLDRSLLQNSDLCLTDTEAHADYYRSSFTGARLPEFCRLWASALDELIPVKQRAAWHMWCGEPFRVFFWGNYIPLQGVQTIVHAAHLLRNEYVQFTLTGDGQTRAECLRICDELKLENIRFVDWMSPAEIHQHAQRCQVALGIFGTSEKAARVIPNKVFQSLAMGIPVITRRSPAVNELLTDGDNILLVRAGAADELAEKIRWVRQNYSQAIEIGLRGHETFRRNACPEQLDKQFRFVLNRILPSACGEPSSDERDAERNWKSAGAEATLID